MKFIHDTLEPRQKHVPRCEWKMKIQRCPLTFASRCTLQWRHSPDTREEDYGISILMHIQFVGKITESITVVARAVPANELHFHVNSRRTSGASPLFPNCVFALVFPAFPSFFPVPLPPPCRPPGQSYIVPMDRSKRIIQTKWKLNGRVAFKRFR